MLGKSDAASGTVIYRSKMHSGLKRNFQVMSGAACRCLLVRALAIWPLAVRLKRIWLRR